MCEGLAGKLSHEAGQNRHHLWRKRNISRSGWGVGGQWSKREGERGLAIADRIQGGCDDLVGFKGAASQTTVWAIRVAGMRLA